MSRKTQEQIISEQTRYVVSDKDIDRYGRFMFWVNSSSLHNISKTEEFNTQLKNVIQEIRSAKETGWGLEYNTSVVLQALFYTASVMNIKISEENKVAAKSVSEVIANLPWIELRVSGYLKEGCETTLDVRKNYLLVHLGLLTQKNSSLLNEIHDAKDDIDLFEILEKFQLTNVKDKDGKNLKERLLTNTSLSAQTVVDLQSKLSEKYVSQKESSTPEEREPIAKTGRKTYGTFEFSGGSKPEPEKENIPNKNYNGPK